jgi:hypothetical protein
MTDIDQMCLQYAYKFEVVSKNAQEVVPMAQINFTAGRVRNFVCPSEKKIKYLFGTLHKPG